MSDEREGRRARRVATYATLLTPNALSLGAGDMSFAAFFNPSFETPCAVELVLAREGTGVEGHPVQ